ncbi:unnamed protein product, partial [Tenebrio molitor]
GRPTSVPTIFSIKTHNTETLILLQTLIGLGRSYFL